MKDLREEYQKYYLNEDEMDSDPVKQFRKWFDEAVRCNITEPNAMVLSSISQSGPDSRTILLKGIEQDRFQFFTNYRSAKATQLIETPACSLLFVWLLMERQIKIRGKAYKMTESESEAYFETRPRGSQLGAWASDQSSEIESREILDQKLRELELQFDGKMIPKPQHWGGFEVEPLEFEFWQGRPNRLHDRIRYRKEEHVWIKNRLQP